jgi:hypothetical protein
MNQHALVIVTSLLSIIFFTFHFANDIVRGFEPGGFKNAGGILIVAAWLYGTLALGGRRSGHILMLFGAVLGSVVPLAHMRGAGLVGGKVANSSGIFFWVWTLIALGVTASISVVLSARGLWSLRRSQLRSPTKASVETNTRQH